MTEDEKAKQRERLIALKIKHENIIKIIRTELIKLRQ